MGVKFGTEGPPCQIPPPHRCNVAPLRGEKPQNRPLSKLNTGRLALRAMLPVKTVSGKVVAESIAFRVVSIYWQDDPFPLKSWLHVTYPLLKAASFDTFCLVAPQPQEIEKEVQLHLNSTRAFQRAINQGSTPPLTSSKWG